MSANELAGSCASEAIRSELVAYLDDELDAGARAAVEAHLESCAACREEIRFYQRTWDALGAYPEMEPSPDFLFRLNDRLAAEDPAALGPSWVGVWLARAAAAAAVLAVAWFGRLALERLDAPPPAPVARLTAEEKRIVADLQVLADRQFDLIHDLELVEHYPALDQLTEGDYDEM